MSNLVPLYKDQFLASYGLKEVYEETDSLPDSIPITNGFGRQVTFNESRLMGKFHGTGHHFMEVTIFTPFGSFYINYLKKEGNNSYQCNDIRSKK